MSGMQDKGAATKESPQTLMEAERSRRRVLEAASPLKEKVDANVAYCDATFGPVVEEKRKQISSVSGLKKLFTDPFGTRKDKFKNQLAEADAQGAACIANAENNALADLMQGLKGK